MYRKIPEISPFSGCVSEAGYHILSSWGERSKHVPSYAGFRPDVLCLEGLFFLLASHFHRQYQKVPYTINLHVFREEIRSDRQIIIDCLDSYRIENRNRLFHKDYFNKWSQVTQIRENTIFLYIALLSAVDLELINKDGGVLTLLDDNYERLYNIFSKYKSSTFTIVFENRRYHSMKIISKIKEGLRYDAQGVISNKLEFKRDDCFYDDEEYLTITNKNVPKEVWIEEIGKLVKKIW